MAKRTREDDISNSKVSSIPGGQGYPPVLRSASILSFVSWCGVSQGATVEELCQGVKRLHAVTANEVIFITPMRCLKLQLSVGFASKLTHPIPTTCDDCRIRYPFIHSNLWMNTHWLP